MRGSPHQSSNFQQLEGQEEVDEETSTTSLLQ